MSTRFLITSLIISGLASALTGCISVHYRNPIRQSIEYKVVTRRIGDDRLKRVKQHDDERPPLLDKELGTDAARHEGVFLGRDDEGTQGLEILVATQNFNTIEFTEREQVPYDIDARVIIDEATLLTREPQTCIEVVLNTESLYERNIEQLEVLFEVDSEEVEFVVEEERRVEASLWYTQRFYWIFLHEALFEYSTRSAKLCAPVVARQVVTLKLLNDLYSVRNGEFWQLSYRWFVAGR